MNTIQNIQNNSKQDLVNKNNNNAAKSITVMMNSILDGEGMRKRFDEILGKRAPQFISALVTMVNNNPALQKCFIDSPMSVIQSGLKAATFDLPIDQNLGYAYIVPFSNYDKASGTKKNEATFILGWKGMHQLAIRTGAYKTINVTDVREGELKSYNRLTEEIKLEFVEDEAERNALPIIGYVGYYRLVNGAEKTIYMTKAQIEAHEKKFRKGQYMGKGWQDDFDAMALKTVYRKLIGKWGIMSIDYQTNAAGAEIASNLTEQIKREESNEEFEIVNDMPVEEPASEVSDNEVNAN